MEKIIASKTSIHCPECGGNCGIVKDSRNKESYIYRMRECCICGFRYPTYEITKESMDILRHNVEIVEIIKNLDDDFLGRMQNVLDEMQNLAFMLTKTNIKESTEMYGESTEGEGA